MKELAVNGGDLLAMGIPQGKRMGEILKDLFEVVLERPEINTKEQLLEIVRTKYL